MWIRFEVDKRLDRFERFEQQFSAMRFALKQMKADSRYALMLILIFFAAFCASCGGDGTSDANHAEGVDDDSDDDDSADGGTGDDDDGGCCG